MRSSEKKCVGKCVDRWIEAMQIVSKSLIGDAQGGKMDHFDEGMLGFDNSLTSSNSMVDDDWK